MDTTGGYVPHIKDFKDLIEKIEKQKQPHVSAISVQHGLERQNTGRLQTAWVELPGRCNLACSYCYAKGGEKLNEEELLDWVDYEALLYQLKEMGVDSVGIPGAGEPFLKQNRELTMKFLNKCAELGLYVTVFSTAEFIDEELADELYELPVEIMVKCNSLNPETQDRFVSDPERNRIIHGFGQKRNEAIHRLMRKGFNDEQKCLEKFGRKSRMALVTSIMTSEDGDLSNLGDMNEIQAFCRENNIILDVDSVLKRGRGATCNLHTGDKELRDKLIELQTIDREKYGVEWGLSQSYIGTVCDRHMHHMYFDQYGKIYPCIGCLETIILGDIRDENAVENAWESEAMRIIRNREYSGKCSECGNFQRGECNSCLGRRIVEGQSKESIEAAGSIEMKGCWNFDDASKDMSKKEPKAETETSLVDINRETKFK